MKNFKEIRTLTTQTLYNKLSIIDGVCSITLVGSFTNSESIDSISDIDVIVIVDTLNENIFNRIYSSASSIIGEDCGLPEYKVKLNMTFGPLKFNSFETIVFHIMVYDLKSHRKHVIDSPFTCYDWQKATAIFGLNLSEIYPSDGLQLNDIIGSRRGLESYLNDLDKGVITYRSYVFEEDKVSEKKETFPMDERHKKEYAYHVVKFLMLNFLKILFQENKNYTDQSLAETFGNLDPAFPIHMEFFIKLSNWKKLNDVEPSNIFEEVKSFINSLSIWFDNLNLSLPCIYFIRHAKTALNDGSFLGSGRDPDILDFDSEQISNQKFDIVFTSSLKRTIKTGALIDSNEYLIDPLLNEINYGNAEGLKIDELRIKFPHLIDAWSKKEDPHFPLGENQKEVLIRLNTFIEKIINTDKDKLAVVTHNIILRMLLFNTYNVPLYKSYLFNPLHLEQLQFRIFRGVLIPEFTLDQRIKFKDQLFL